MNRLCKRSQPLQRPLQANQLLSHLLPEGHCHSWIPYRSLRVTDLLQIEGESMGSIPPGLIVPSGMQSLNLQIKSDFGPSEAAKGKSLTKFASQLTIDALEQGSASHPLSGNPFQLVIGKSRIKIPFKGRHRFGSRFSPSCRPRS